MQFKRWRVFALLVLAAMKVGCAGTMIDAPVARADHIAREAAPETFALRAHDDVPTCAVDTLLRHCIVHLQANLRAALNTIMQRYLTAAVDAAPADYVVSIDVLSLTSQWVGRVETYRARWRLVIMDRCQNEIIRAEHASHGGLFDLAEGVDELEFEILRDAQSIINQSVIATMSPSNVSPRCPVSSNRS